MTSGTFSTRPISSIIVDRATRQRRELRGIDELAESIARLGLINPITIDRDGNLIAGERRYTACSRLGWTDIPVQFIDDLDDYTRQCIEFEENVKRLDLTWQEEVAAVEGFHKLKLAHEPDWSADKTADALGVSARTVSRQLAVAAELDNEKVASADKLTAAYNLVERAIERRKANANVQLEAAIKTTIEDKAEVLEEKPEPEIVVPMKNISFHDWQPGYSGPKFNLIHCDFPYGINVADAPRMDAALADHYEDSPDVYWALVSRLGEAMHNVVAESAHLIFWFSMDYYEDTVTALTRMGWKVNKFPLIWHKSDNMGIAPDPQRWPRRTYETALVASRGDRKLTQAGPRANSFAFPGSRKEAIHISEKPVPMLKHFLSMFCDEYSIVLDPTAGSGSAIKAAEELGAMSCLGLEMSKDFYEVACANWQP